MNNRVRPELGITPNELPESEEFAKWYKEQVDNGFMYDNEDHRVIAMWSWKEALQRGYDMAVSDAAKNKYLFHGKHVGFLARSLESVGDYTTVLFVDKEVKS